MNCETCGKIDKTCNMLSANNRCRAIAGCIYKQQPKQEKVMQKFENNAPVTVIYAEDRSKRNAEWIGMNRLLHVVKLETGGFCEFGDDYIKPRQLICDEAREVMLELVRFKARVESKDIYDYIEANIAKSGTYLIGDALVTPETCMRTDAERRFNETNLPELDLKTGEIVPCEEPEKKIENCCHCYGMSQQLTQEQTNNDKLKHQLKEANNRISKIQDKYIDACDCDHPKYVAMLGKKDQLIEKQERHNDELKERIKFLSSAIELSTETCSKANSLNSKLTKEIAVLKSRNKDLCDRLHEKDTMIERLTLIECELGNQLDRARETEKNQSEIINKVSKLTTAF